MDRRRHGVAIVNERQDSKITYLLTYLEITYITFTVTLTLSFEIYLETIVPKFMQFWLELAALEKLC